MTAKKTARASSGTTKPHPSTHSVGAAASGPHPPLPLVDLSTRTLDVETIGPRDLYRISWPSQGLFWSPKAGEPARGRFDAPSGEYQVHYSAYHFAGAFVEALLRQEQPPILAWSDIVQRELFGLRLTRAIRVMPMFGHHLVQLRAKAAVASGPYAVSRQWSLALSQWSNPDGPLDGLLYPSRHNDSETCLALFSRAATVIEVVSTENLGTRRDELLALRRRYRFPLDLEG